MNCHYFPFSAVSHLNSADIAYAEKNSTLKPFYQYEPHISSFRGIIEKRKDYGVLRKVLHDVLSEQYSRLNYNRDQVSSQIDSLLHPDTFTVTTAHQPTLFTGPLYFIYKIISVIKLSRLIKEKNEDYHIVPVFVLGGEDHDFEEMNHAHIFSKTLVWENTEGGPVGRMSTGSLKPVLSQLKDILGESESAQLVYNKVYDCYFNHKTYADATFELIHQLFGSHGLVVINMDHPKLKRLMADIFKEEIKDQTSYRLVKSTQEKLQSQGFKAQAFAREVNLFFLNSGTRERIECENGSFAFLESGKKFTTTEIIRKIEDSPEMFSPNVILRPLYQELVLPNLAYIGGGSELSYWLERKAQFEYYGIHFPMLVRRDSCLIIEKPLLKKMEKFNLSLESIWKPPEELIKEYVHRQSAEPLSLGKQKTEIDRIFKEIESRTRSVDLSLVQTVAAEKRNQIKSLETLEKKLIRAEKQKHETELNQIRSWYNRIFPNGELQERYNNFLPYFLSYGPSFFDHLMAAFNPLDMRFKVLIED